MSRQEDFKKAADDYVEGAELIEQPEQAVLTDEHNTNKSKRY